LKKRSKKLLSIWRAWAATPAPGEQSFFGSFFSKKELLAFFPTSKSDHEEHLMLREEQSRPFRGVGVLQRWYAGVAAIIGREQQDMLRRETEELRVQMLALAAMVTELRARQSGRPPVLPATLIQPASSPAQATDPLHRAGRFLEQVSARLCWLEPWWIEGLLLLNSLYAAWVLLARRPDAFARGAGPYGLVAHLLGTPTAWGIVALLAALSIGGGLALTFPKARIAGLLLRLAGTAISGVFWFAMGVSALLGDPASVFAMAPLLCSLWAFWVLIRFPAVP
jgi:hypothetical protein